MPAHVKLREDTQVSCGNNASSCRKWHVNVSANRGCRKKNPVLYSNERKGNVKEYKGFLVDDDLKIYNSHTGKLLSPYIGSDGYQHVSRGENKKCVRERVHIIYAHCFLPNPNNYKYVNHIDSNKLNNSLDNLEWCTNSYNVYHGWHSGNRVHKNHTKVNVYENGELAQTYPSIRKLSEDLNLDRHKVARILKGELNNHYPYTFQLMESRDYRKDRDEQSRITE